MGLENMKSLNFSAKLQHFVEENATAAVDTRGSAIAFSVLMYR